MFLLYCFSAKAQTNLLTEGFESTTFPPTGWTILNLGDQTNGETWMQSSSHHHTGDYSAFSQDGEQNEGMEEWLITPAISVPSNSYIEIAFWHKFLWGSSGVDPEYVLVSTTTPTVDAFTDTVYTIPFPGSAEWQQININDLPDYAGQTVYIAFLHYTGSGNGYGDAWVIDDISVDYYETGSIDVGVLSVENPEQYSSIDTLVYPTFTIKNFGTDDITDNIQLNCEIRNSSGTLDYSALSSYSSGLAAGATDQVSFAGAWTPDTIGIYSVKIWTVLPSDVNTVNDTLITQTEVIRHYGTGGPDDFGYNWIDNYETGGPVYNWIEISETGESSIQYGFPYPYYYGDDNLSAPIPFGFAFNFYGIDRDSMYIDTNGEILLADNNWYNKYPGAYQNWGSDGNMFNYMYPIPGNTSMPALVSVFWDDLIVDENIGDVYFQTFGTEPNRYCVVEWYNLRFLAGTVEDTTLNFEVIFHENGDMKFQYKNVNIGQTGSVCPHDNGQSATIGIQNDTYDIGLSYLFEIVEDGAYIGVDPIGNLIENETAVKFYAEDNQAPFFTYEGKGNTFDNTPEFNIKIMDLTGVRYDSLYYNTGSGWQAVSHSAFEEPNIFYYELPEIPNSTVVNYYFAADDSTSEHYRRTYPANAPDNCLSFKILPTTGMKVLLAYAGDQDDDSLEYNKYTGVLDNKNINYDVYDWQEYDDYKFTSNYDVIFAYANNASASYKHDTLSVALMDYLDMGTTENPKNLFFASDDFSNSAAGWPNSKPMRKFEEAYIRSWNKPPDNNGLVVNGYNYVNGSVIGVSGTPIGKEGVEMPVYANSPDVIINYSKCPSWYEDEVVNPTRGSAPAFIFEDGPTGHADAYHYSCSSWLDNLIYKSFFMTFDLSQFTDDDINTIITDALQWFIVTVNLGNDTTACEGDTVTLDAGNGYDSYLWSTGSTLQTIDVTQTDNYSVTVTNNGNQAVDSINVTFNPNPVVDLGADTIVTVDSLLLDAGAGFDSYLWSTGETSQTIYVNNTGTYSVTVIDINGCSGSDTVTVTINTDINDLVNNCNISIYPNPSNGKFSVIIKSNKTQNVVLELYDINAHVIYKKYIYGLTTFNKSLDISELSKGIYYLRVKTNDNVKVKKVVIF